MALMQFPEELDWLCNKIAGANSILEIGSWDGSCLALLAKSCAPGARIRSIDLGLGGPTVVEALRRTVEKLREDGYDAEVFLGNSHAQKTRTWASQSAPYDLIFIDGDHNYAGVKADWEEYRSFAKAVGFHDVCCPGPEIGVIRLWHEIQETYDTEECCLRGNHMGIGFVNLCGQ
jgi:predicted O-methyltransferase YrrM